MPNNASSHLCFSIRLLSVLAFTALLAACSNSDKEEAEFQAKVEKTRSVLANQCSSDADCIVTGCHHTMCRAMPDEDFCDHRIVIAMDSADDVSAVRNLVSGMLTIREAETIRLGGYAAGKWTLSFQAPPIQRQRIENALQNLSMSGFARLHPKSPAHSEALFEALIKTGQPSDFALRDMKGAGPLVEKQIRSGDVLSKDDIRTAWEQIASSLDSVQISEDDNIERFWAYDVLFGPISQLRLWPIDKRQRISVRQWTDFDMHTDNGDIIITATLLPSVSDTFRRWTESGSLITLLVGNEVIASTIPRTIIEDGRFELVILNAASNDTLTSSLFTLESIIQMKGGIHIDRIATQSVEKDISCHHNYPRTCACIQGNCDWAPNPEYDRCLFE